MLDEIASRLRAVLSRLTSSDEGVAAAAASTELSLAHPIPVVVVTDELRYVARSFRDVLRPKAAFVACDSDQSAANRLSEAAGGVLYLNTERLPVDTIDALARSRELDALIVVGATRATQHLLRVPILIPSIAERDEVERARIVDAHASHAHPILRTEPHHFRDSDREWLIANAQTVEELEVSTHRFIAYRADGGRLAHAATRLGVAENTVRTWRDSLRTRGHVGILPTAAPYGIRRYGVFHALEMRIRWTSAM